MVYSTSIMFLTIIFSLVLTISVVALPSHCTKKCGNINIPYPFGVEDGCYLVEKEEFFYHFKISCNYSTSPPKPIYGKNVPVLDISLNKGQITILGYPSYDCYPKNQPVKIAAASTDMKKFTVSTTENDFVVIGCDTYAWFDGLDQANETYHTGCMTQCGNINQVIDGACNGTGCCKASMAHGITDIQTTTGSFYNHTNVSFNPCSAAFPVAKDAFNFSTKDLYRDFEEYQQLQQPVVFDWMIGNNCSFAKANRSYLCKENSECHDLELQAGYRCKCKEGYSGNPYLTGVDACQDVDECKNTNECEKHDYCYNTNGSYTCRCPTGYHGNGTKSDVCTSNPKKQPWFSPVIVTAAIGGGIIILLLVAFYLHWQHGKRHVREIKDSFFRQNGGFILRQKLSTQDRSIDRVKVFTEEELANATNNYNDANIIGRGGFGVVYKGNLPNNLVVAIKKSLKVNPTQVEQFINEVLVLSQINNRNVVKLLGCCLETEVPLLIYEYIRNGTLYEHLHDEVKALGLAWHIRLMIASEVANVLSYLHTTISTPIIHRDMKSMNILLDEDFTAKVSDFGASRLVPADQDQLATMVLGTCGYLDPEYMQTSELTEKSDVYSFGVILVELLTRRKAISYDKPENERSLAMHFLMKMKENCLFDIVDKSIVEEKSVEQIEQVARIAKWCLKLKGEERPKMKEVARELEEITRIAGHPWYKNHVETFDEDTQYLLRGIPKDNGGYSSSSNSDLYKAPHLVLPLGDGR